MKRYRYVAVDGTPYSVRRKPTPKEKLKPRSYWLQLVFLDESVENRRMENITYVAAVDRLGRAVQKHWNEVDVAFLLDGNIPECELECLPSYPDMVGIWNRAEPRDFTEGSRQGKPVNLDIAAITRAIATAR